MEYGDEWGEQWGDAIAEIEDHVGDSINRLTYPFRDATDLKKLLAIHSERVQTLENILRGITPVLLFDLETAYGAQLDQIGVILFLPREAWDDDLYRVYLRTMALLILPRRRTQGRLIEVVRSLMNTPAGTITYEEYRPKTYLLGVQGVPLATLVAWKFFLEFCRPATYNALITWISPTPYGRVDGTGAVAPTMFPRGDSTGTILGGGLYSAYV